MNMRVFGWMHARGVLSRVPTGRRVQDVRSGERESVQMYNSFRPGDMVQARVVRTRPRRINDTRRSRLAMRGRTFWARRRTSSAWCSRAPRPARQWRQSAGARCSAAKRASRCVCVWLITSNTNAKRRAGAAQGGQSVSSRVAVHAHTSLRSGSGGGG